MSNGHQHADSTQRHAIVTGAASGLGRAIAVELARRGWCVALADVNEAGSAETLALVKQAGGDGRVEPLDVTKPEAWRELRERLERDWKQVDLLVNNAGVGVGGEVGQLSLEDWRWIIDINLYGAIYGCHTFLDWMKRNPRGSHVVNIASLAAIASAPGMAPYNMTKAAMLSLSETLYSELRPHNIGVTGVCPAFFPTNIIRDGRFHDVRQRRIANRLMAGSRATAEDVARRVVRAVERRQLYVFVPGMAGFFWRLKRLMPTTLLGMIARRHAKAVAAVTEKTDPLRAAEGGDRPC